MNRTKKFILALPELIFFFSIFLGSVGLIWTIIEILDRFKVDLTYFESLGKLSIYLITIHSILVGFVALYLKNIFFPYSDKLKDSNLMVEDEKDIDAILVNDLAESLEKAIKLKNYDEVIRIGSALSKPFFISGNYKARLRIGLLVEEAAALIHNEKIQMIELVDSIGWMNVELGDIENGLKYITHGYKLAEKNKDFFYMSKCKRHFGAIHRRNKEYNLAITEYESSLTLANKIESESLRKEAIAGTNYAQAILYFSKDETSEALKYIDSSLTHFVDIDRPEKVIMAKITKAQILFSINNLQDAKDLFRVSLNESEKKTLRLETIRSLIGLTKIYFSENNITKAKECLNRAEVLKKEINSANEIKEINQLWTKLPK